MKSAKLLRWDLRTLGLSDAAIDAAWPEWWSDTADASTSAQTELRFSISRKLGLDPKSLLDGEPHFVWTDQAKFKRLTSETNVEKAALISFGASVARFLLAATNEVPAESPRNPLELRELVLRRRPYVGLVDLLTICWGIGLPVIHLRIFPLSAKRMTAMVVRVAGRFAILLGRDARYPAVIAYYLAHELGHAALGHLADDLAVVEFGDALTERSGADDEEVAADQYALKMLTGMANPKIIPNQENHFNAPSLAKSVLENAAALQIEPGVLALCFGHSTGAWPRVFAAMNMIYHGVHAPIWDEINSIAFRQLNWAALGDDAATFLRVVMRGNRDGRRN